MKAVLKFTAFMFLVGVVTFPAGVFTLNSPYAEDIFAITTILVCSVMLLFALSEGFRDFIIEQYKLPNTIANQIDERIKQKKLARMTNKNYVWIKKKE